MKINLISPINIKFNIAVISNLGKINFQQARIVNLLNQCAI